MDFVKVCDTDEEIHSIVKVGGYHEWNWKFPFRHLVEEKLNIATENEIHTLKVKEYDLQRPRRQLYSTNQ